MPKKYSRLLLTAYTVLIFSLITGGHSIYAQSGGPAVVDLATDGWVRNTDLLGVKIDRYRSDSGSIAVDLMAFPPTTKSAGAWLDEFVPLMIAPDKQAGHKVHIINNDEMGSATGQDSPSGVDADTATRTVMVMRPGSSKRMTLLTVGSVVRPEKPVQVSLMIMGDNKASDAERAQADRIRYAANMPLNESAAFLGLEPMIGVMTEPLIYPGDTTSGKSAKKSTSAQPTQRQALTPAKRPASTRSSSSARSVGGGAPNFRHCPGQK